MKKIIACLRFAVCMLAFSGCSEKTLDVKEIEIEKNTIPLTVQNTNEYLAAEDINWMLDGEEYQTNTDVMKSSMILTNVPREMETNDSGQVLQPGRVMGMLTYNTAEGGSNVHYYNYGSIRKISFEDKNFVAKIVKSLCRIYGIKDEETVIEDVTGILSDVKFDEYRVSEIDYGKAFLIVEYLAYEDDDCFDRVTVTLCDENIKDYWREYVRQRRQKNNEALANKG